METININYISIMKTNKYITNEKPKLLEIYNFIKKDYCRFIGNPHNLLKNYIELKKKGYIPYNIKQIESILKENISISEKHIFNSIYSSYLRCKKGKRLVLETRKLINRGLKKEAEGFLEKEIPDIIFIFKDITRNPYYLEAIRLVYK